jgi:hypothetical protein
MIKSMLSLVDEKIKLLHKRLLELQFEDGGFKGYHVDDLESSIWTSGEIVHLVCKTMGSSNKEWLQKASKYLLKNQNKDGGWPFRPQGKSVNHVTAWVCLALDHTGNKEAIQKGIKFLLESRSNEKEGKAWGLTISEKPRIYPTYYASYCLGTLLRSGLDKYPESLLSEMNIALSEAKTWLLKNKNPDGGWGSSPLEKSTHTSTAQTLFTLFIQSEDPKNFEDSYNFLKKGLTGHLWTMEREIVITQEGYELTQEWFTSLYCFRALIFFAEMDIAGLEETDAIFNQLMELILPNGNVKPSREASGDLVWTIPYMLDLLDKYKKFILGKKNDYSVFLKKKQEQEIEQKKNNISEYLHNKFPYPISYMFSQYERELDYTRKFQLLIQLYEVIIKYSTIVCLSGHISAKEENDAVKDALTKNLRTPTLGQWAELLRLFLKKSNGAAKILRPKATREILESRPNYLDEAVAKKNLDQELDYIISTRNKWAHGALFQTVYEYKEFIENEQTNLYSFLDRMSFLAFFNSFLILSTEYDEFGEKDKYRIRIFNGLNIQDSDLEESQRLSEGQKQQMIRYIYFQNTGYNMIVNLYPFLSFMFCKECKKEHFFFYNGKKGEKLSYLSYECGHTVVCDNNEHFVKRLKPCGVKW